MSNRRRRPLAAPGIPRSSATPRERPHWRRLWGRWHRSRSAGYAIGVLVVLLGLFLLVRAGFQSSPHEAAPDGDSQLLMYQGEDLVGGKRVQIEQALHQGRPVVLNFFAGQCPSCRAEMPAFQQVADSTRGRVIFVGVDVGPFTGLGSHEDAQKLLRELRITYAAGYAVSDAPLRRYRVDAMPTTIIFDARGIQVSRSNGVMTEAELRGQLHRLAEAPSP